MEDFNWKLLTKHQQSKLNWRKQAERQHCTVMLDLNENAIQQKGDKAKWINFALRSSLGQRETKICMLIKCNSNAVTFAGQAQLCLHLRWRCWRYHWTATTLRLWLSFYFTKTLISCCLSCSFPLFYYSTSLIIVLTSPHSRRRKMQWQTKQLKYSSRPT